eukprot:14353-Pelagococcus_subviridis.AAC.4
MERPCQVRVSGRDSSTRTRRGVSARGAHRRGVLQGRARGVPQRRRAHGARAHGRARLGRGRGHDGDVSRGGSRGRDVGGGETGRVRRSGGDLVSVRERRGGVEGAQLTSARCRDRVGSVVHADAARAGR